MTYFWLFILKYAFVIAAISTAISLSKPLAPVRRAAAQLEDRWLGPLLCCPWCLNYWLAAGLVAWRFDMVQAQWWDYIATWCVVSAAAGIVCLPLVVLVKVLDGKIGGPPVFVTSYDMDNPVNVVEHILGDGE